MCGEGKFFYPSGKYFVGYFENDMKNGFGM